MGYLGLLSSCYDSKVDRQHIHSQRARYKSRSERVDLRWLAAVRDVAEVKFTATVD